MPILTSNDFGVAFSFARSEVASVRNATGALVSAPINTPRFDHSAGGAARGLLITAGSDIGGQDRASLDPLMLPVAMVQGSDVQGREATVFHAFRGVQSGEVSDAAFEASVMRRAYYTREAISLVDALLQSQGHHVSIGVRPGFSENRNGFARYRGWLWQLPTGLSAPGGVLAAEANRPVITSGARLVSS